MTRKAKKTLLFSIIPTVAILSAILYFTLFRTVDASATTETSSFDIVAVETLTEIETIEISGNIEPANSADLAFPIAGYIDVIKVAEGDFIQRGDVVATLKDSQQRYDLAEVNVEIATESVSGTQRNLELLKLKKAIMEATLEDTRLSSTISGYVSAVNFKVGDYVTAQAAGAVDDVVVRVIDRLSMTAVVEVDELDAPQLMLGQTVKFQFDAFPELDIVGEVTSIPLEARKTTQGIAVLDTEVTIFDPPTQILPYFTFAGEIILNADEEVLLLPESAVLQSGSRSLVMAVVTEAEEIPGKRQRNPAGKPGAGRLGDFANFKLPDGHRNVPVPVTVKDYDKGRVQILSGLKAGDSVMVPVTVSDTNERDEDVVEKGGRNPLELLGMPTRPGGPGRR